MLTAIKKLISELDTKESTVNLYTLNRKQGRINLEKKYEISFATTKGDSKEYILKTIKKFLADNLEKIGDTQEYFDFNIQDGDYYLKLNSASVTEFAFIQNRMKQKSKLPSLRNLTDKTTCLVIELIINENQYLFFQKVDISPKIKRKFTSLLLKEGVFNKIVEPSSEELGFPPYFNFLYLDKSNDFLIFNKFKFEQSFDFRKFYEDNSKKAISELENKKFVFSKELKENLLIQPRYMNKFTKLLLCKGLVTLEKRDLSIYEKGFGIKLSKDNDGNVLVANSDDLNGVISILQKECVVEATTHEPFLSKSKIKVILDKINLFK